MGSRSRACRADGHVWQTTAEAQAKCVQRGPHIQSIMVEVYASLESRSKSSHRFTYQVTRSCSAFLMPTVDCSRDAATSMSSGRVREDNTYNTVNTGSAHRLSFLQFGFRRS